METITKKHGVVESKVPLLSEIMTGQKLYTKEEVEELIRKCRKETYNGYSMNKWLKENL